MNTTYDLKLFLTWDQKRVYEKVFEYSWVEILMFELIGYTSQR